MKLLLILCSSTLAFIRNGSRSLKERCYLNAIIPMSRCKPEYQCDFTAEGESGYCRGKAGTKCKLESDCLVGLKCVLNKCSQNQVEILEAKRDTKLVTESSKSEIPTVTQFLNHSEVAKENEKKPSPDGQVKKSQGRRIEQVTDTVIIISTNGTINLIN